LRFRGASDVYLGDMKGLPIFKLTGLKGYRFLSGMLEEATGFYLGSLEGLLILSCETCWSYPFLDLEAWRDY